MLKAKDDIDAVRGERLAACSPARSLTVTPLAMACLLVEQPARLRPAAARRSALDVHIGRMLDVPRRSST